MSQHFRLTLTKTRILVNAAAVLIILAVYNFGSFPGVFTRPNIVENLFEFDMTVKINEPTLIPNVKSTVTALTEQISKGPEESIHPPSSTIILKTKKNIYKIGDVVEIEIVGMDQGGRRKHQGGDMVRIWVKDLENGACAAGRVIDNQDGSYRGVVKLLWAGSVTIVAGIGASRELIQLVEQSVIEGRSPRHMAGKFLKGDFYEIKKCTPMDTISLFYRDSCNLTEMNSNLPWYCEKPAILTCNDWVAYQFTVEKNYSSHEQNILSSVLLNKQVNTTVRLTVESGGTTMVPSQHFNDLYKPNTTCNKFPAKYTWSMQSPVGYLYKGRWYSTQCQSTFDGSVDVFRKCLHGRKLWLFGDSTSRQLFIYFNQFLKLKLKTEKWGPGPWHKPSLSSNKDNTISVFWAPHALPFNHAESIFDSFTLTRGTHVFIDRIPSQSRDIIVVHFYLHFMAFDPSIVRIHFRRTAESIKALKTRAPDVKVLVKSSHSFHTMKTVVGQLYDFWGIIYDKIAKEEFAFLAEDVILLDFWDITVATESWDRHVNDTVLVPMIHQLMAFVCS